MPGIYPCREKQRARSAILYCSQAPTNRNRAQYHDLSYLEGHFRHDQYSQDGVQPTPPSPRDPYAMVNGYHHYHHVHTPGNIFPRNNPQPFRYQQGPPDPASFGSNRHPSHLQGQVQANLPQNDRLSDTRIDEIRRTARDFVQSCCPLLGEKPYCLPPIKRYRHPDKSNKKLIQGMESEKRVFGTFERFFVEQNLPVFMLCYYPLSGFLQVFRSEHLDKPLMTLNGQHGKNTVMLLLSSTFAVTVVSVSIISGNSQFEHLRQRVVKTVSQMKEISATVSKWLTLLGVRSEVRQVIAFPNLRRSVMERVCKDKQLQHSVGSFCTLHIDELSAPFEEEWTDPVQKRLFHMWMLQNVLSRDSTLLPEDLHLVVGALLSPKLSKVDFIQEEKMIMPIPDSIQYIETEEGQPKNAGQMKLTIDGVTKSFDEFMDLYVTSYYPNVGERTYRVPPIHFNIQSLKKPTEYINAFKGDSVLRSINGGPGNNESTNLENHLSARLSKMACNGEDTRSNSPGETSQCKFAPSSISAGKISPPRGQGESAFSSIVQGEHSFSNNLQISGDCVRGTLSLPNSDGHDSPKRSPERCISSSGIYFKESSNSSSSLLCTDITAGNILHSDVTSASYVRSEYPDYSLSVGQTPASALLQAVEDVDILSKVMDKDIRKDEGENRVISALEMLGHQSNFGGQEEDPMFIICGYQYNNYLNKLREEMFSKEDMTRPVRAFGQTMRAEHDCLIFHKNYGAIIVCIKAIGDNFEEWHATEDQKISCTKTIIEKALKQLQREEDMIRHVTSDLPIQLKCHKLIALPNMSRESVKTALWTDLQLKKRIRETLGHEADLFLCLDELPPKHTAVWDCSDEVPPGHAAAKNSKETKVEKRLITWWKQVKLFLENNCDSRIELPEYKQLIGRYCGLFSTVEVWSPTNPRIEVRSASEAVKTCAERFCKFVLLPCQLKALCSNIRYMFLYGPPGCGKTLILLLKAKQWLLAGKTVVWVNSRSGSKTGFPYAYGIYNRLVHMLEYKIPMHNLRIINVDPLSYTEKELDHILPCCCVIMDEVTPASHKIIESLRCRQVSSIWCAGLFDEDMPNTAHAFATHKMDKIIRCPPAVQSVLRHTEEAVRLRKPYEKVYQSRIMEQEHCMILKNDKYNKYTDTLQKNHVAYFSELQKGQKEYNKSITSKNSLHSLVRQLKVQILNNSSQKLSKNSFLKYTKKHSQIVDNIWTKDSSYCSESQKVRLLPKMSRPNFCLKCTPEARYVYRKKFMRSEYDKDRTRQIKRSNSSSFDDKLAGSSELDKDTLLGKNCLPDDLNVIQLAQMFSDDFKQNKTIAILNAFILRKYNKALQIVDASSDTNQVVDNLITPNSASSSLSLETDGTTEASLDWSQQQAAEHLTELNSASSSTKVANNDKVATLENEKLKYDPESLNERLVQKFCPQCNSPSIGTTGSETVPQDSVPHEVQPVLEEDIKHDPESVDKRLAEKYGNRRPVTSEISSLNFNAPINSTTLCDSEFLNKRPAGKYDDPSITKSPDFSHPEASNNSLSPFTILTRSEELNRRLMEKYNGSFIKRYQDLCKQEEKRKRSPFNNFASRGGQNFLLSGHPVAEMNFNVSKHDSLKSDFLNTRVQKYRRSSEQAPKQVTTGQFCDGNSHTEMSLSSDGLQPKTIDHSLHSKTGSPTRCEECAHELLQFLNTMIRPDDQPIFSKRKHNFYETKLKPRGSSENGHCFLSSSSSFYTKGSFFHKPLTFENRALSWSDVLIVADEMTESSDFFKVFKNRNIPVEVCFGNKSRRIEESTEKKLFITSYKETTGIERPIIVFIPSERQVDSQQIFGKDSGIDLKLANCINRYSEDDKAALWYVASRSLAYLVLVLP